MRTRAHAGKLATCCYPPRVLARMHRGFDWESAVALRFFYLCTATEIEVSASAPRKRQELVQQSDPVQYSRDCFLKHLCSVRAL